jgi:phosphatidate cytidylyltransferase
VVAALVVSKLFFVGVVVVAILLAVHELTTALAVNGTSVPVLPLYLGTVAIVVAAYFGGPDAMVLALAFTVIATMAWRLPGGAEGYLRDASAGALCAVYLPFMAGFALLLLQPDDGAWRVVTFIAVVAASDTGGYAVVRPWADTRWLRRSARRSPGRASAAPSSHPWRPASCSSCTRCPARGQPASR